jgi:hypothetical protein
MNEERFILATLKRRLLDEARAYKRENGYWPSWVDDVLRAIAEIEADAVLGEDIEAEAQEVE